MKITEQDIKNMVMSVVNEASKTSVYHSLIRKLYKVAQPWTSHKFRDDDWSYLHKFIDELREVPGVSDIDVNVKDGGYEQYNDNQYKKEYQLHIHTEYDEATGYDGIKGTINCYLDGPQDNPMETYDMVMTLWINKEANSGDIFVSERM